MAKTPETSALTELQLEILQVLWECREASVGQVQEALAERGRKLAYTTVMTLCRRMADRGVLTYVKRERAYIYSPAAKRSSLLKRLAGGLVQKAFGGSETQLIMTILEDAEISPDELDQLRKLLAAKERELHKRGKSS
jgi:predicted transcriptional regulator